jgi:hypothetical protein
MESKTAEEILRHHLHSHVTKDNLKRFYALVSYEREIEAMEIYATQEREKAVNEFKEELLNNLPAPYIADDLYYMDRIKEVIEKLK